MAYLCRFAVPYQYRKNWAVGAKDCVHGGKRNAVEETNPRLCSDCLCLSVLSRAVGRWLRFTLEWKWHV